MPDDNIVRIAVTPAHDPERLAVREHEGGQATVSLWQPVVITFANFEAALKWAQRHVEERGYPDMEITIRQRKYVEGYGWQEA